jgi:GNAT superfamily N-acetyltransferase
MPADVRITNATEQDTPLILELIRGLAEYERLAGHVTATEEQIRQALLASVEGKTVGFAVFFTNYSTFLARPGIYLEDLFVKPHARGHGAGKALLGRIAQLAVERGCGRVEWSVLDWNAPSIRFYESLGAVAMNEWTTFRLTGESLAQLAAR